MALFAERYCAQTDLCVKAQACAVPAISVDGNDVLAVVEATEAACRRGDVTR